MAFRNGNKKSISLKTMTQQFKYRAEKGLCLHCGKRPCSCKEPLFAKEGWFNKNEK